MAKEEGTTLATPVEADGARKQVLIVYHRDGALVSTMSAGTHVVVGRSAPSDTIIDDPTLSRRHASFTAQEDGVIVEDLGSKNGTRLNGVPIERAFLRPGDQVEMGAIVATLQEVSRRGRMTGIEGYDRFLAKIDDEVVRSRVFRRDCSLVFVRQSSRDTHVSKWLPAVRDLLRPVDHVTIYGPGAVMIGLPETETETAVELARRIAEAGADLLAGVASYPSSAASSEELVDAARAAAKRATYEKRIQVASARETVEASAVGEIIAASAPMKQLLRLVDRVARSAIPVLLLGETGSGKEVVAAEIHRRSARAERPMRSINCAAIPETLIESVLFGHEKGSFTGAERQTKGVFEQAHGGTVLLDEVGELSPAAQASLLRVLETKRVSRVGSDRDIEVDVRVVAATHRDLETMVAEGGFREDLLYRLNTMMLEVPALRSRPGDVRPLAEHFLVRANEANETTVAGFSEDALATLDAYPWPGNVRELRNAVERASVIADGERIEARDLPDRLRSGGGGRPTLPPTPGQEGAFKDRVQEFERDLIADALERAGGNQTEAAKLLQMPLRTLVHKIGVYGLRVKEP